MAECAHRLGVTIDLIRRPIQQMTSEGLLVVDPDPPRKNARYRLRDDLAGRAEEEAHMGQRRGAVLVGQVVFLVRVERLLDLANALRNTELTRSVVWVGKLDSGNSHLLVLDGTHTAPIAGERLRAAIEGAGGTCTPGRTEAIMDSEEWRRQLAAVRDAAL